jgi:hypothetical protein
VKNHLADPGGKLTHTITLGNLWLAETLASLNIYPGFNALRWNQIFS